MDRQPGVRGRKGLCAFSFKIKLPFPGDTELLHPSFISWSLLLRCRKWGTANRLADVELLFLELCVQLIPSFPVPCPLSGWCPRCDCRLPMARALHALSLSRAGRFSAEQREVGDLIVQAVLKFS